MPSGTELQPIKVFYSYAHKDQALREELAEHLSLLENEDFTIPWHDRCIQAGQEWDKEIDESLNSAQLILLLISPAFMRSKHCYGKEMKRALARHEAGDTKVIPVHLRRVHWQGAPFGKLQSLPTDARPVDNPTQSVRDNAFYDVVEGIRKVVEELRQRCTIISARRA